MSKITINKNEAFVKIGEGMVAITTIANVDTNKNFGVIIHPTERLAKLGDEMDEYVGKWASDLPTPHVRIEFSSSEAVKVFIRQLRKIDRDLRE